MSNQWLKTDTGAQTESLLTIVKKTTAANFLCQDTNESCSPAKNCLSNDMPKESTREQSSSMMSVLVGTTRESDQQYVGAHPDSVGSTLNIL